jgi:hypothetical protein
MATINLGSIKFKWQGAYAGGTAYTVDDVVSYQGSSYICIQASTGNLPTNATYWEQMSSAGTNGTDGTDLTTTLTTQGDIVYRDASGLQRLGAGTSGQALITQGTGANPIWGSADGKFESQLLHITSAPQNTSTTGSWTKLGIDTVRTNEVSGASLSSSVITLPAGTYFSMSTVQFYRTADYNARLRNVSDGIDLIIGSGGHTWEQPNDAVTPAAHLNGRFTLAAQKNVELQYYVAVGTAQTTAQNGHPNQVLIWKIA